MLSGLGAAAHEGSTPLAEGEEMKYVEGTNRRSARALVGVPVLVAALAFAAGAMADPDDGVIGSDTYATESASSVCPAGKAVTGVAGKLGDVAGNVVVGSATVECQDGATGVGTMGSDEYHAAYPDGATRCGDGQVGVGIVGREGDFVDQLALRCRDDSLTGAIANAGAYGGLGGGPDGPYDCATGQWLVGLDGSADNGDRVTEVEIRCARPAAPNTKITKQHPRKKTTKRRAEFKFVSIPAAGARFECKLDRKPFKSCTSPFRKKVKPGKHRFKVRAILRGVTDPSPAKFRWRVVKK